MKVDIVTADHPDWAATTSMIAMVYRKAYGARLTTFMPRLLKVAGPTGMMRAVVGMRCAADQKLFLETYLDDSIENVVTAKTGEIVGRDCIMEIGNLAESRPGDARLGIIAATMYLHTLGYRWVVFTAVPQLLNAFKRLGVNTVEVVAADPGRIPAGQRAAWGTYYDEKPMVCLADIASGFASLTDFDLTWLGAKKLADEELQHRKC